MESEAKAEGRIHHLSWVPDLVRKLHAKGIGTAQVHDALFAMHKKGVLHLRPEGGMNRLSRADADLAPRDHDGIPLTQLVRHAHLK